MWIKLFEIRIGKRVISSEIRIKRFRIRLEKKILFDDKEKRWKSA